MKRIITILVALFIMTSVSHTAEQRVLIENHTGAWCQWCPNGTVYMDKVMEANPGKVIGIKYHQSDGMQCDDGVRMYQFFGQVGVPSGPINRIPWKDQNSNTVINLFPENWEYCSGVVLATQPTVDVSLVWKYNDATQKISGTITCNVLSDISTQLAFQVIIAENNVTGTGSGFDQANAFSNNPTYPDHPYHDLPNPIVGYVHNKVARAILGGVTGNVGNFPATVKAGETYKWDFISDVPSVPAGNPVKMADVFLVGVVGQSQQGYVVPVLNSVIGTGGGGGNTLAVDGDDINYSGSGQQSTFKLILDNTSNDDKTYNLSLVKSNLSPDGWLAQIVGGKTSVTVKKSSKANLSVDVYPGEKVGNGIYNLVATDASDASSKLEAQVEVVHTGAERLYIHSPVEDYDGLNTLFPQSDYNNFSSISVSRIGTNLATIQAVLAKFTKVKTAIISMADDYAFTATDITLFQYYYNAGVDIILDGTLGLCKPEIQSYLNTTFGFGWSKQFKTLNSDQEIPFEGISADNITNGFTSSLTVDKNFPSSFSINDATKAKKMLVYSDKKSEIAGIKCDNNGTKLVALGFAFANMTEDQKKLELLDKSIYWLENEVANLKPTIAVDKTNLNFGNSEVNATSEKALTISNKGNADLTIDAINVSGTDGSAFKFGNITYPKILKPDEDLVLLVKFSPTTEKDYTAILKVLSDDTDTPELSVDLSGTGIPSSVQTESGSVCSISLSPNPVTTYSQISYNVTGSVSATIRINDAQGKIVAEIYNGILNAGTYNYSLNTNNLSSGNYFITAQFDGKWETVPFVVVK